MYIENLPFHKKAFGDVILQEDLHIHQWVVPKHTVVKTKEGQDFGYLVLPHGCKDVNGDVIPQRLFRH
jgi:hypothetical protein